MSAKKKAAEPAETKTSIPATTPVYLNVRVLAGTLQIGGSSAARGAQLAVSEADAEYFAKRGEVQILGVFER